MFAGLPLAMACASENFLFALEIFRGDVFLADELRIAGRNVHGDVVHQFLEVVGAGDEIALAVNFHQHANLASGVDVAGHRAFAGHAGRLLRRHRNTLLAQNDDRLFHVALGFGQGLFAIHHWRSGLFPELFHLRCRNIHGSCAHRNKTSLVVRRSPLTAKSGASGERPKANNCPNKL